jgi:hypothetical protein
MSHFYGTLQGARGEATRCGTKASGITTHAAGWQGAIRVDVFVDEDGRDSFTVHLVPWQSSGGQIVELASGRLDSGQPAPTWCGIEGCKGRKEQ